MSGADRVLVWVDRWQLACCGTPFSVGDSVGWTVSGQVDSSFLKRVVPPGLAARIDYAEQHHGDDEPLFQLAGLVCSIRVASCRYELEEGGGSGPAAGSGRLQDVSSTDEEPASIDGEGCPGWVVKVRPFPKQ